MPLCDVIVSATVDGFPRFIISGVFICYFWGFRDSASERERSPSIAECLILATGLWVVPCSRL